MGIFYAVEKCGCITAGLVDSVPYEELGECIKDWAERGLEIRHTTEPTLKLSPCPEHAGKEKNDAMHEMP